tara:strand:- start:362 stop:754 length:393 start_codon:yes stop_codon:yes gene_type:complete
MGIPRELRIRKNKDFQLIRKEGLRRVCPYFIVQLRYIETQSNTASKERNALPPHKPLLGVIAVRRVGNAVLRNRGKRIMRNLFIKHLDSLPSNSQLVIILRAGFEKVPTSKLENDFLQACNWFKEKSINR